MNTIAHNQWANRPRDERFETLSETYEIALNRYQNKELHTVDRLQVTPYNNNLMLFGDGTALGMLNFHSMGQLAQYTGLPVRVAHRLGETNVPLVAQNYTELLAKHEMAFKVWRDSAEDKIRGITSDEFSHIYDKDLINFLLELTENETNKWRRPPAYTDDKYPSGYYLSDKDCFFIVTNDDAQIDDGGMGLGIIVSNSEVGNSQALRGLVFGYRYVCGNHCIWGYQEKAKWKIVHRGDKTNHKFLSAKTEWEKMTLGARNEYERVLKLARSTFFKNTDEAVEKMITKRIGYTEKAAHEIIEFADQKGWNPTNVFALWDSATVLSHGSYQDRRFDMDVKAGKILSLAK